MRDLEILVLAAMPRELRRFARALRLGAGSLAGLPAWRGHGVVAVAVGVGPMRASAAAARVLGEVAAGRLLITGVAGAVDPALKVGDVLRPAAVVDTRTGRILTPRAGGGRAGLLATVPGIATGGATGARGDGPQLPDGATAVDMETAAIAAAAEDAGVPWDVIRAISDTAGTLTQEVAALIRPDGRADLRVAARVVLRDPRTTAKLVTIGIGSARATRAATRAVVEELASAGIPRPRR